MYFGFGPIAKRKVPNLSPEQKVWISHLYNIFKFSTQGEVLAPFFGNGTKVKIPSEIKPPLVFLLGNIYWMIYFLKKEPSFQDLIGTKGVLIQFMTWQDYIQFVHIGGV